jgi:DNA polymerase-3 subunit gamma/tau
VPPRAGLGAPLAALPASAIRRFGRPGELPLIQRIAAAHAASSSGAGPVALPLPPSFPADASGHDVHADGVGRAGSPTSTLPPARSLPVLPVARRASAEAPPGETSSVQRVTGGAPAGSATIGNSAPARPAASAASILPLLGARPLRPAVAVQRDADAVAEAPATDAPALPVPARWGAAGDLPATVHAAELPAPAVDAVPIQRLSTAAPTPPEPVAAVREMTFPAPAGGQAPSFPSASLSPRPAAAVPSPMARQARSPSATPVAAASPAPTLQLARAAGQPASAAPQIPATTLFTALSPVEPAPAHASTAPTVQTMPAAALPTFTATPVVQRVDGASPAPAPAPTGTSDRDLDELSRKLFGRLRGQIRAEIVHEREARGLNFDSF